MNKQIINTISIAALAVASIVSSNAQAGESQSGSRTGMHKCYHSGSGYCRAQMKTREREYLNKRRATAGAPERACENESMAQTKAQPQAETGLAIAMARF